MEVELSGVCVNWSVYREGQSSTCLSFFRPAGLEVTLGFHCQVTPQGKAITLWTAHTMANSILRPLFYLSVCHFLSCHKRCFSPAVFLCLFRNPPSDFLSVYCSLCLCSLSLSLGVIKSVLSWIVPLREGLYVPSWLPRALAHRASLPSVRLPWRIYVWMKWAWKSFRESWWPSWFLCIISRSPPMK